MKTLLKERFYLIPYQDKFLSERGSSLYGVIHEGTENKTLAMERHFNDVYKFFIRKLGTFEAQSYFDDTSANELTSLLKEVIESKRMIEQTTD